MPKKDQRPVPSYDLILENEILDAENLFCSTKPSKTTRKLMRAYDMTQLEVNVFSIILQEFLESGRSYNLKNIKRNFDLQRSDYLIVLKQCQSLIKKNIFVVNERHVTFQADYLYPDILIDQTVFSEIVFGETPFSHIDFDDIYSIIEAVSKLFHSKSHDKISEDRFFGQYKTIFSLINPQLPLYNLLKRYDNLQQIMAILAIESKITDRKGGVGLQDFVHSIFSSLRQKSDIIGGVMAGSIDIFKDKILEFETPGRFARGGVFSISEKYFYKIADGFDKKQKKSSFMPHFTTHMKHKKFKQNLFFDEEIQKHLSIVTGAVDIKRFKEIVKSLRAHDMPSGLAMLLYGAPGTGKTATVYEIAKKTKRDVLQVDISAIRDKYVGESEKRLKEVFSEYYRASKVLRNTPILLFNEADALIGKRIRVSGSVDQMNNTMQNILLEELEKFQGIFFATTNLVENIDGAFERRFLYKIKYASPSAEIRREIWHSKMPVLTDNNLEILKDFELTGGQIENISRKYMITKILKEEDLKIEKLVELCYDETEFKGHDKKCGFIA